MSTSAPTELSVPKSSTFSAILWAVFLGVSWTWCIGMFLPVLLIRDYGPWGWVAFAVPNVLGAAAMGWVLGRPGHSESQVAAHRPMAEAFSIVTLAFHIHFAVLVAYLCSAFTMTIIVAVFLLVFTIGEWRRRGDLATAPLVWINSVLMLVAAYLASDDVPAPMEMGVASRQLLYLLPVTVLGFLLCPYLDLTFHRARQAVDARGSKIAFGLGFGFFFLLMIIGTYFYAPALATAVTFGTTRSYLMLVMSTALALHMGVPAAFTTSVHIRELQGPLRWAVAPVATTAVVAGLTYPIFGGSPQGWFEGSYRVFMGFYGLVFPAYVWICMVPTWRTPLRPSRRMWITFTVAVIAAMPMYWLGFIERRTVWLLPGIAIILLARLFVGRPSIPR